MRSRRLPHLGQVLRGLAFAAGLGLLGCGAQPEPTLESAVAQATVTGSPTPVPSPTATSTATAIPTSTSTAVPTNTATMTPSPTSTATPTPTPPGCPLPDFPLELGNTWIYASIDYAGYGTETITMSATITDTVVEIQLQPPIFAARVLSEYRPDRVSDDLEENRWAEDLPMEGRTDSSFWNRYWYVISGTQVAITYEDVRLSEEANRKRALSVTRSDYVFPLTAGACWDPQSGEPVEAQDCWGRSHREVAKRLEPSWATGDPGTRFLTITYSTRTREDDYKDVEAKIELDDCATDCSECFLLITWYNNGAYREWFCPGVGFVGSFWHHAGSPFGRAEYLIDYTLHEPPGLVATASPTVTAAPSAPGVH